MIQIKRTSKLEWVFAILIALFLKLLILMQILGKYDSSIDTDLLKLSALAENNTPTFEMLLKTLRSM